MRSERNIAIALSLALAASTALPVGALAAEGPSDASATDGVGLILTTSGDDATADPSQQSATDKQSESGPFADIATRLTPRNTEPAKTTVHDLLALGYQGISLAEANAVKVSAIKGDTAAGTAAAIARRAYPEGVDSHLAVLVGNSDGSWVSAMTVAPLASGLDAPILYSGATRIPAETAQAMEDLGIERVLVIGGRKDVGPKVERALREKGIAVSRLSGKDRYATQMAIYSYGLGKGCWSGEGAFVVSGKSFADALAASAAACKASMPIFLVPESGEFTAVQRAALEDGGFERFVLVEGAGLVSRDIEDYLEGVAEESVAKAEAAAASMAEASASNASRVLDEIVLLTAGGDTDSADIAKADAAAKTTAKAGASEEAAVDDDEADAGANALASDADADADSDDADTSGAIVRLTGTDRYDVSGKVAAWAVDEGILAWDNLAFSTGKTMYDGLAGSVFQGRLGAPLVLIRDGHEDALASLKDAQGAVGHASIFGSNMVVSRDVREDIADTLGFEVTNIEGFHIGCIPDVSHWDRFANLDVLVAKSEFVIVKCTQGTRMRDWCYQAVADACNTAGRAHWDYTFMEAGVDPVEQAKYLIANSDGATGFVLDVEDYNGTRPTGEDVDKAARYIVSQGYKCIVYYMEAEAADYRWVALQPDIADYCANWCARYGDDNGMVSALPTLSCDIHQYTSVGLMPGIAGGCDLSRYTGTGKHLSWFRTP